MDASGAQSAPFAVPEIGSRAYLDTLFKTPRAYLDALFDMPHVNIVGSFSLRKQYIAKNTYLLILLVNIIPYYYHMCRINICNYFLIKCII